MTRPHAGTLILLLAAPAALAAAPEGTKKYQPGIDKGLKWLADRQEKDGRWQESGGANTVQATSLAGLAFLAAGNTLKDGKYAKHLRKAADWVEGCADAGGRFIDPGDRVGNREYLVGHGYAILFLSQVYAADGGGKRKQALGKVLEKAAAYAEKAQAPKGGWGFVAPRDGGTIDEGYTTAAVLHGVFACRKAGVTVPRGLVKASLDYLKNSTRVTGQNKNPRKTGAGVIYSLAQDRGDSHARPELTVAALALLLNAGETEGHLAVQWLNYLQNSVTLDARAGNQAFTLFYFAQLCYQLGEEGHARLRPDLSNDARLKWSTARKVILDEASAGQQASGAWKFARLEVQPTAMRLIVLQMGNGKLPYYKRPPSPPRSEP